jgi:hypothetical protein
MATSENAFLLNTVNEEMLESAIQYVKTLSYQWEKKYRRPVFIA